MRKNVSFRNKITTAIVFLILFLGLIIIFAVNQILPQALRNAARQTGVSMARSLAARSAAALLTDDITLLKYTVNEEKKAEDVDYAFILDWKGRVLAHTFEDVFPVELKDANSVSSDQGSNVCPLNTGNGFICDIAAPILIRDKMFGVARIGIREDGVRKTINNLLGAITGVILLAVVLAIFISFGLAGLLIKPIKNLHDAVEKMAKGNLDVRVKVPLTPCFSEKKCGKKSCPAYNKTDVPCWLVAGTMCEGSVQGIYAQKIKDCKNCEVYNKYAGDEVQQLSETFNYMAGNLKESQEKLVRSEKLATIGQLAASVAHEIRNPLGVMKNVVYYLNMLEVGKDNPDVKENLQIISDEIEITNKIIGDLLEFSRI
ncbi:MAG: histidine kinase dimerization/phospho-acceptor domain-containing protein, partial [Planctomycetota bacterium]